MEIENRLSFETTVADSISPGSEEENMPAEGPGTIVGAQEPLTETADMSNLESGKGAGTAFWKMSINRNAESGGEKRVHNAK